MEVNEKLVELRVLISGESYEKFFDEGECEVNLRSIFERLNKIFDVKRLECHDAVVCRTKPQLFVKVSGNGTVCMKKGWEELAEIIGEDISKEGR